MIKIKNIFSKKNIFNLGNNIQHIKKYNFSIFVNKYKNGLRLNNFSKMNFAEKSEQKFKNDAQKENNKKEEEERNKECDQNDKTNEKENTDDKETKDELNEEKSHSTKTDKVKNPNLAMKFWIGFKKVWKQTFPSEMDVEEVFEKRKEEAIKFKSELVEFTDEQIDEIETHLPEWKRGAVECDLVINHDDEIFVDEEESQLKLNIDVSGSTLLSGAKELMQKSNILTPTSKVVEMIIRRIPSFDLLEFEKEVNYIFRQAMGFYFNDDLDQLKKIASEQALALMTGEIRSRVDRKIEFKHKELFHMEKAIFFASSIKNNSTPVLRFRIQTQEINCLISKKDQLLVEGKETQIQNIQYVIELTPNSEPLVEELGHEWLIVGFERVGIFQQLV